jgi:hypothetical protein
MTFKSFDRDVYKSCTWQYTSKEEQFGPDEELSGVKINDKKYTLKCLVDFGESRLHWCSIYVSTDVVSMSQLIPFVVTTFSKKNVLHIPIIEFHVSTCKTHNIIKSYATWPKYKNTLTNLQENDQVTQNYIYDLLSVNKR